MPKIVRLTLFKIPDASHVQEAVKKYSTLSQDAVKANTPYIQVAHASPTYDDPRNQGFTMCARTVFNSKEDMDYYDNECVAHQGIKSMLKGKVSMPGGVCMLYMDAQE